VLRVKCFVEGVDNAIEISVVLSTGEYLTVNNYQNPDLFWALRGGGGGTYGIVTSVTYRTYPSVPAQFYLFQANVTNSSAMQELVGELLHSQTQFTDDGWGGYGSMNNQTLCIFLLHGTQHDERDCHRDYSGMDELCTFFGTMGCYLLRPSCIPYPRGTISSRRCSHVVLGGANLMFTSRLLSRDTVATKYKEVAQVLIDCSASFKCVFAVTFPFRVADCREMMKHSSGWEGEPD
jgi:hypothetical protein